MSVKIAYKGELFDLVNDLTSIHNSIAFERVDDEVVVRKCDKEKTIPYILKAPAEYFDIDETVAFYKYDNFYRYYSMFKDGKIGIDGRTMHLSRERRQTRYTLSDSEGIINGPKRVNFGDADATFTLTKEELDELNKMIGLISSDKATIKCEGTTVYIRIFSDDSDHDFVFDFECERGEYNRTIEFNILSNRFSLIPSKRDYTISLKKEKQMRISLNHDDIDLDLYSGTID